MGNSISWSQMSRYATWYSRWLGSLRKFERARSRNKELHVIAETVKGHAAGCFLDGVMITTGCTYGKSNIKKLYYNKMAFTLIDVASGHRVRISYTRNGGKQ